MPQLLARWDDSVVFSFPLLTAMRQFHVSPSALDIRLGEFISFSRNGPFIPIDKHGRLAFSPEPIKESITIAAPALIDGSDDLLSKNDLQPTILRNDLSSADQPTREFSKSLVGTIASLTNPSLTSEFQTFSRLHPSIELCLLGSLVMILTALAQHPLAKKTPTFLIAACALAAMHFLFVPLTALWLPTLPAFAALSTFAIVSALPAMASEKAEESPLPSLRELDSSEKPETPDQSNVLTDFPAKKRAATKTTKKAPAKRTAKKSAKKAATKKTAKKAAKKSTCKVAKKAVTKTTKKAAKKTTKKAAKKTATKKTTKKAAKKTVRKTPAKKTPPPTPED